MAEKAIDREFKYLINRAERNGNLKLKEELEEAYQWYKDHGTTAKHKLPETKYRR